MAKRFTDSRKYQDPWFRRLPPVYKCFWDYVLNTCNHAGIWKTDFEMASFCIGQEIHKEDALRRLEDRIEVISGEKWFIPKYVAFQYGRLNPDNRCHKSALDLLTQEGVNKGLISTLQGCKDKDKDKDKDIVSSTNKQSKNNGQVSKSIILKIGEWFEEVWSSYPRKLGKDIALKHFNATVKTEEDFKKITRALKN